MIIHIHRVLGFIDRVVHEFFRMERDETRGLYIYKNYFWGHWGRRCAIIDKNGRVTNLGYSWTARHHYDEKGILQSRLLMRRWAGPTDRVLYGHAADKAWSNDSRSQVSMTGGFEES